MDGKTRLYIMNQQVWVVINGCWFWHWIRLDSVKVTGLGGGTLLTECHSSCNMDVWTLRHRRMYLQGLAQEECFNIHRLREKRFINLNLRRDHTRWFLTSRLTWKRKEALHVDTSNHPSIIWNSLWFLGSCEGGRNWSQLTLGDGGVQ